MAGQEIVQQRDIRSGALLIKDLRKNVSTWATSMKYSMASFSFRRGQSAISHWPLMRQSFNPVQHVHKHLIRLGSDAIGIVPPQNAGQRNGCTAEQKFQVTKQLNKSTATQQ